MISKEVKEIGRESKEDNDLFFTCSLIEYIARSTKNKQADIVNTLGIENLSKIYELADVYHSDNIVNVCDEFIKKAHIEKGDFDNIEKCLYNIPTYFAIGKVYKRLIKMVADENNIDVIDALIQVYNSFICTKIDDYNSSMYYENPSYLFECYKEGKVLD